MISVEVRGPRGAIASAVVLVTVAATQATSAQSPLDLAAGDLQDALAEDVAAAYADDGRYSKELIAPLTALSLRYQETGNHVLALATAEQAQQIVRANYGLRSLEQVPLVRQRIASEEARGNFAEAWQLEREVLALARAHPNDLETASVFREIGAKRMDLLERYLAGEFPPQIVLGCFYGAAARDGGTDVGGGTELGGGTEVGGCTSGSRRVVIERLLVDAHVHYAAAINVLRRLGLYSSSELRELELELLRSSYDHGAYLTGRQSLTRLIDYDIASAEPLLKRVGAIMQVADWDLLFEERQSALETYDRAYRSLKEQGVAQATLDELFSPEMPVVLPTFMPSPLSSDGSQATGHVDVAFDISRFGAARRLEVLGTSNASAAATERLVELIADSRFRPRMTAGEFGRTTRVVARYFVSE